MILSLLWIFFFNACTDFKKCNILQCIIDVTFQNKQWSISGGNPSCWYFYSVNRFFPCAVSILETILWCSIMFVCSGNLKVKICHKMYGTLIFSVVYFNFFFCCNVYSLILASLWWYHFQPRLFCCFHVTFDFDGTQITFLLS